MANYTDHYKIKMDADVTAAKKQIQDLYNTIGLLSKTNPINNTLGGSVADIKAASAAASELEFALKKAVNVETGKLNLKTFNNQLLRSGKSLKDYQVSLNKIGPEGQKAFRQLAQAVMTAEKPMFNFGNKLKELGESMGNTIRWQISSSIMNGLIGAVQKATNHVKTLNKSLNDIRIVTGVSAEKMDKFADKANKAAQKLNVATTAYTDASLIFYQQGLSDDEVEKRTETVLKLSNVTGESAEDVSSYMTAIWNNFADGSKELEYYADVMTKLGAATAASTDEIAAGLDKFAAVSDTIGLSYEYATSALATVVSETRQSADVVGTAFKTIFTRLEGLQLGDTLEDGTTLNKYSQALATVGVNIKDTSGELKDMDMILDELGVRWKTLAKDEQVALAQTVAGTRQYTQLIALMENYDKFKGNVNLAEDASGTLQDQADTYADSWEAASKRVRASAEDIYQSLLDDDFFIGINNGFSSVLDSLNSFIDGLGGLKGILPIISTLLLSIYGDKISSGIDLVVGKIRNLGQSAEATRQQAAQLLVQSYDTSGGAINADQSNFGQEARLETVNALKDVYMTQSEMYSRLNELDKQRYDTMKKQHETLTEETMELGKQVSQLEKKAAIQSKVSMPKDPKIGQEANTIQGGLKEEDALKEAEARTNFRDKMLKRFGRETDDVQYETFKNEDGTFGVRKNTAMPEDESFVEDVSKTYQTERLQLGRMKAVDAEVMNQTGLETVEGLSNFIDPQQTQLTQENLEKIGKTEFNNLVGSLEKTKKNLEAVTKSVGGTDKLIKAFGKDGADAIQTYTKGVQGAEKASKNLQAAQQKMAKLKMKFGDQAEQMEEYKDATNTANQAAKDLVDSQQLISQGASAFNDALTTNQQSVDDLSSVLKSAGVNTQSFDQLADTLGMNSLELAQRLGLVKESAEDMQNTLNQPLSFGQIIQGAAQSVSGLVMGINSLASIYDTLTNPETTGIEKLLSTLMALGTALPGIIAAFTALDKITKKSTKSQLQNAGATTTQMGADMGHVAVLWAKVQAIMSNPWMLAATIVAIGLATILVATKAQEAADKKHTETLKKKAEAVNESNEATKEEIDSSKELIDTYNEAKRTYESTGDAKADYISATKDLIDQYYIEGGMVDLMAGKYVTLAEKIREARAEELKMGIGSAEDAIYANARTTRGQLSDTNGMTVKKNNWWNRNNATSALIGSLATVNMASIPLVLREVFDDDSQNFQIKLKGSRKDTEDQSFLKSTQSIIDSSSIWSSDGKNIGINYGVDLDDPEMMMQAYKEAQKLLAAGGAHKGDLYNALLDFTQQAEENGISDALEAEEQMKQYTLEMLGLQKANEAQKITTQEEYNNLANQIEQELIDQHGYAAGTDELKSALNQVLESLSGDSEVLSTMDAYRQAMLGDSQWTQNENAMSWFDSLDEESKKYAIGLKFDKDATKKDLDQLLSECQGQIEANKLQVAVEAGNELTEAIAKGTLGENYADSKANYITLFGSDKDWNRFLMLDPEEQAKMVADQTKKKEDEEEAQNTKNRADAIARGKKADSEMEKYAASYDFYQSYKGQGKSTANSAKEFINDYLNGTVDESKDYASTIMKSVDFGGNETLKSVWDNSSGTFSQRMDAVLAAAAGLEGFEQFASIDSEGEFYSLLMGGAGNGSLTYDEFIAMMAQNLANKDMGAITDVTANFTKGVGGGGNISVGAYGAPSLGLGPQGMAAFAAYMQGDWGDFDALAYEQWLAESKAGDEAQKEQDEVDAAAPDDQSLKLYESTQALAEYAEQLDISEDVLNDYTKTLMESNAELSQYPLAARKIALANLQMSKGVEDLGKDWEDYKDYVQDASDTSVEAIKGFSTIRKDVANILTLADESLVSNDFIVEHYNLIGEAAEGSIEAIQQLQKEMAADVLQSSNISLATLEEFGGSLDAMVDSIQSTLDEKDLTFGATLDDAGLYDSLQAMLDSGEMTAQQMNDFLDTIGFEPEIEYMELATGLDENTEITLPNGETYKAQGRMEAGTKIPYISKKGTRYRGDTSSAIKPKSSSNGGGGGEKKKVEDEVERYHQTERTLSRLERLTKNLSDAKNEAFGQEKIDLINAERYALEQELKTYQALDDEILKYLAQDKANIAQYGATFDEYGNISNYEELVTNMVNRNIAGEISSEEFDQFKKWLSQYEETLDKWYTNQDNKLAKQREIVSKKIEAIDAKVEIKLHLSERELQFIESQLERLQDEAYSAAEQIGSISEKTSLALENSKTYQDAIKNLENQAAENLANGLYTETGGYSDEMRTNMEEYADGLLEQTSTLLEAKKEVEEMFGIAIDETSEILDEQIGRFDSYGAVFENYKNILGLSGKSVKDAALMIDLGNKSVQNSINKLESTRKKQEALQSALLTAETELLRAMERGDSESVKYWEEEIDRITIQVEEGMSDLTAAFEETLQAAADNFAAAVEQTMAVFSANITAFKDLDIASDNYEKQKTLAEQYLDINTQNYELSKLMRNINAEIDKTDNLASKIKLRDVLEEINEIQANNAELSQYDLDMLNAKYQLKLAEIALEEAQNAKSQVRLTQTAGGGWGYVYTADQGAVDKAEQDYEDKLYNIQKLSQDRMNELSDNILQNYQEYRDAIGALKAEDFENKEAYMAEIDRLTEYYTERDKYLQGELDKAVKASGQTYKDTLIGQTLDAETYQEAHTRFVNEANATTDSMSTHYDTWKQNVSGAYKAAGENETAWKNQLTTDSQTIINKSNEVKTTVTKAAEEATKYISKVAGEIGTYQTEYSKEISEMISSNDLLYTSIADMFKLLSSPPDVEISINTDENKIKSLIEQLEDIPRYIETVHATTYTVSGSGSDSSNFGGPEDAKTHRATASFKRYSASAEGSSADNAKLLARQALIRTISEEDLNTMFRGNLTVSEKYRLLEEGIKYSVASLDTGGYTGAWGAEGKLAMLHEKEIVLNKFDTANLLTSIEIVRSIAQQLDALSQYQRMFDISAMLHWPNGNQPIEQNVYITAEFPEATNRYELEEAFKTLMNYSSQYINRYNK